jgi:hypothetical protein
LASHAPTGERGSGSEVCEKDDDSESLREAKLATEFWWLSSWLSLWAIRLTVKWRGGLASCSEREVAERSGVAKESSRLSCCAMRWTAEEEGISPLSVLPMPSCC